MTIHCGLFLTREDLFIIEINSSAKIERFVLLIFHNTLSEVLQMVTFWKFRCYCLRISFRFVIFLKLKYLNL